MAYRGKHIFRNAGATKQSLGGAGMILSGVLFHNDDAAEAFIQLFDKVIGDVTVGTTVPDFVVRAAADSFVGVDFLDVVFENAITFAVTTTAEGNTTATANHIMFIVV